MSGESFRFIHISDVQLEQPLAGFTLVPDHLMDALADAPHQAFARCVETAILEDVDFVVISGNLVDINQAGPGTIAFLLEQLNLLHEQRIKVYWAGGVTDSPDQWPEELPLPEVVHRFPKGEVRQILHCRGDLPVANILGMSANGNGYVGPGDFRPDSQTRFTVAVAFGQADAAALSTNKQVDYWALGGRTEKRTISTGPPMAHYSGSPQGRSPRQSGVHGATLVSVELGRKIRTKFIDTDVVTYRSEVVQMEENANRNDLQRQLRAVMQKQIGDASDGMVFISLHVQADAALTAALRSGGLDSEILDWLRTEFGRSKSPVWATELNVDTSVEVPDELYEEDTILGDFMRAVQEHENDERLSLNINAFAPDTDPSSDFAAAMRLSVALSRGEMLQRAAALGMDLLKGEEVA